MMTPEQIQQPTYEDSIEERKHGADVEMMSIGSHLRLDILEEQGLRNNNFANKPPKTKKQISNPIMIPQSLSNSSGSEKTSNNTGQSNPHSHENSSSERTIAA